MYEETPMVTRLIFLAALVAAPAAFAASPINQTRPLAADGQVSIENVKGRVTVRTWDRPEVRITGSLGAGVEKLAIEGDASDLRIEVRYPKNGGGWFGWGGDGDSEPTLLEINVPAKASVSVDAVSANVDVAGTGGRRLTLASVSGDVLVRGARAEEASFESVSGDVDAEVDSTNVSAETVSGDLLLKGRIGGRVSLDTVSGDATLVAGPVERLTLSTVSGDGHLSAGLAASGGITADSVSGNVDLVLPRDTSARLQIDTFSGGISSPVGEVQTEEYGPGKSLKARLGAGSGSIRLESFSGNVRVSIK
jgi:DUF4097 and DUF4098 domain-containing protein YvlB